MKIPVQFEISRFDGYSLFWFYSWKEYKGEWCWLWDDNKLSEDEALALYPKHLFDWIEIKD